MERVAVLTNGTLVTPAIAERFAKRSDDVIFSVSLDGPNPQVNDALCGSGSFEHATRGIKLLTSAGLKVRASMCLTPKNIFEIEPTILLAKELGAAHFSFSPVAPFGRGTGLAWAWNAADAEKIASLEFDLVERYKGFVTAVRTEDLEIMEPAGNCGIGYKNVVLSPSGKIRPCLYFSEHECFGDLTKESLAKVFTKPVLQLYHDINKTSDASCAGCRYAFYCKSCPARAIEILRKRGSICGWAHDNRLKEFVPGLEHCTFDPTMRVFS